MFCYCWGGPAFGLETALILPGTGSSSEQATFFQSSLVQIWSSGPNCSFSFLFLSGEVFCCFKVPGVAGSEMYIFIVIYLTEMSVYWVFSLFFLGSFSVISCF